MHVPQSSRETNKNKNQKPNPKPQAPLAYLKIHFATVWNCWTKSHNTNNNNNEYNKYKNNKQLPISRDDIWVGGGGRGQLPQLLSC